MISAQSKIAFLQEIVNIQACDERLWFDAIYTTEDYLQRALRNIHAAIEEKNSEELDKIFSIEVNRLTE